MCDVRPAMIDEITVFAPHILFCQWRVDDPCVHLFRRRSKMP